MLLHWCTLEPTAANLAAIRFSSPVRVQSIRIFPTDAQPFAQHPEIVSRTEPQAFYLELYFNAYPVAHPNTKEKPKPTNALVPTMLAYTGGRMDFSVPMGAEYATRLMIVKGSYEYVSMAIYGEIMSELPPPPVTYESHPLLAVEPKPLSRALDPSKSLDPSTLARQLLDLIPNAPSLPLAIRLVFCLKPPSDDWDLPEFPYLHPDLDNDTADFDLEKAFRLTTRPVPDDVQDETLLRFAENVSRSINIKNNNQAYLIAGILAHSASQHPNMLKFLLEKMDFAKVFDATNMDKLTLLRMRDAASNADIARHLQSDWFIQILDTISKDPGADKETQAAAIRLIQRIRDWDVLEDALSNTQGDFPGAAQALKEMATEEQSLGIWLESVITHPDISDTLAENPIMPTLLPHPPCMFGSLKSAVVHDEFVAFVRAVVGVAAVLAVYAFADAYPHTLCRERALAIIRLWQGIDGYREIVNHLLLLKQMTFRLECMMDNDNEPPRRGGLDAEHILVNLAKDPHAILQPDLIKCILSLRPPHSVITDDERMSMRQAAIVADDGLPGAIEELLRPSERPLTMMNIRTMRVALAVIVEELNRQHEYDVLREFWEEGSTSLVARLVDVFLPIAEEIKSHFGLKPVSHKTQEVMSQLFLTANELLTLLLRLFPAYPLPIRAVSELTMGVSDLFVCTDAADMLLAQSSPTCVAAQETRQSCIEVIRTLASPTSPSEGGRMGAEVVLRVLLLHALQSGDRDPVHHLLQVFCLVDYLLPLSDSSEGQQIIWTQRVMPLMLQELWEFCRALDTENKAHFVKRIIDLDRGAVGIGEWLLLEELKELLRALQVQDDSSTSLQERVLRQAQVSMSLQLLRDLVKGSSTASEECIECLVTVQDASTTFTSCLNLLLDQSFMPHALPELVQILAADVSKMDDSLRLALVLVLLRSIRYPDTPGAALSGLLYQSFSIVSHLPHLDAFVSALGAEIGALTSFLPNPEIPLDTASAETCAALLEWLLSTPESASPYTTTLPNTSKTSLRVFYERLRAVLSPIPDFLERLEKLEKRTTATDDIPPVNALLPPPDSAILSIHDVEDLLRSHIPHPSTPPRRVLNQDALGLITISPRAFIRSPASTGLTKTYNNNEFRQLRQIPSARQNTSRLPSTHVDEFENASSPTIVPLPLGATALPFTGEGFQPLAPPFNPI